MLQLVRDLSHWRFKEGVDAAILSFQWLYLNFTEATLAYFKIT